MYIPDPELVRDRIGGVLIVPGQENGPDADPSESRDHVFAFFSYRVGQNEISCRDLIDNDVNHSTSFIQISAGTGGKFFRDHHSFQKLQIPCFYNFSVNHGGDAFARAHLKMTTGGGFPAIAADDRFPERMFAHLLGCGGKRINFFFCVTGYRPHRGYFWCAAGKGAGLVERDLRDRGKSFQGVPFPDQKAVLRGISDGRHDRGGRCEHQRAGAEHDENGNRPDDLACEYPGEGRGREGDDDDPGGPPVRQPDDFGLSRIGGLHEPDHPLDGAVFADFRGFHHKRAELVHCTGRHVVAGGFVNRERFARHDSLVDGRLS